MTTPKVETLSVAEQAEAALQEKCTIEARPHTSPAEGFQDLAHEPHHPLPKSNNLQANHSSEEIKAFNYSHHPEAYTDGGGHHDKKK